jgi:conjugative relaxase-like TrwC/TraI family protein
MLLIWDVTSGADAKDYYSACLAPGGQPDRQGYYSEGQETAGQYGGKLGEELGLAGKPVDEATFHRLCDNLHPFEDRPLTLRTNDYRRVCKDFTFSGPKSFSVIEAFANEEERRRLRGIFDEAVTETLAEEIEPDMQTRVRKGGADYDRTTGNALTASFDHATARPEEDDVLPDPHWHKHVLVWNATRDPVEDRIKAGQVGDVVRDKGYYRSVFYSKLADKLEAAGYCIDRRGGYDWEIAGITQSMIDKFSKRTVQIDAEAKRLGIVDPTEKGKLGAKIRGKKQKDLTLPELRKEWWAQLTGDERDALARVYAREIAPGARVTASEAAAYAVRHCFEREAVVSERELVRTALLYGLGSVTAGQVRAELPAQGAIVAEMDGRLMATTEKAYKMERSITAFAKAGRGSVRGVGVPDGLTRVLADGKTLDDEQWNTVTGLLESCDRVQLVDSAAGVGKSTMLGKFDEGMARAGRHVTYLATTTPAAGVLRNDGFAAETVAKFLLSGKMQDAAGGGTVVVDEVSMLGLKDAYKLFQIAKEKEIRLILVGDSRQHSSVPAGAVMRTLQQYGGIEPYRITTIKRQENDDHKAAVKLLFDGRTAEGFDLLDRKLGWVYEVADAEDRYRAMAAEYAQALKGGMKWNEILLLSPTHAEGRRVVGAIRDGLRAEGLIGKKEEELTQWVAAGLTEAERGDGRNYRPGKVDMVQFFQHATGHRSGSRVAIGEAGPPALPFDEADRFQAYRRETVRFARGDIIRFTANGTTLDGHSIHNGTTHRIAGFTTRGIRLENGWLVSKDFGHWKQAIETSFGSQSKTVRLAIVGQSSQSFAASDMAQAYVSASRAKVKVSTYTDDKAALRQAIQRSSLKLAAHDLVEPRVGAMADTPVPVGYQQWRQRRRRRQAYLERCRADAESWAARQRPAPQPEPPRPPHPERAEISYRGPSYG